MLFQFLLKSEVCAESNVPLLEEIVSSLYKQLDPIYDYHDTFLREVSWRRRRKQQQQQQQQQR